MYEAIEMVTSSIMGSTTGQTSCTTEATTALVPEDAEGEAGADAVCAAGGGVVAAGAGEGAAGAAGA